MFTDVSLHLRGKEVTAEIRDNTGYAVINLSAGYQHEGGKTEITLFFDTFEEAKAVVKALSDALVELA